MWVEVEVEVEVGQAKGGTMNGWGGEVVPSW